jgi:Zn-dependent protease
LIVSLAVVRSRRENPDEHMRSSLKIASISGIEVRIHVTFLLFLAWIWFSYYQIAGVSGATQGVLFVLALFTCVLLHEFGHAFAARAFGIQTPDITLLPIGGVARLNRLPDEPWQELVVAVAGPLVNVVIAAVLIFVVHQAAPLDQLESIENPRIELLAKLASVNIMLVLFNLIPAFPMDGGRVLRALLAMAMPYSRATWIAARIGQVLAICLAAYAYFGPNKNPILIFIAFFIFIGAQQEAAMARIRQTPPPL